MPLVVLSLGQRTSRQEHENDKSENGAEKACKKGAWQVVGVVEGGGAG